MKSIFLKSKQVFKIYYKGSVFEVSLDILYNILNIKFIII